MWKFCVLASMIADGFLTTVASAAQLVPVWAELRRHDPALLREIYNLLLLNLSDQVVLAIPAALITFSAVTVVRVLRVHRRNSFAQRRLAA